MEFFGIDRKLYRRLLALSGRVLEWHQGRGHDGVLRVACNSSQGFAFVRGEGGNVDQPDYVVGVGSGVGDHRTAVGMGDGEDRAGDLVEKAVDVGGVDGDAAQRVRGAVTWTPSACSRWIT